MAITHEPMNFNLRRAVRGFLGAAVKAFTPRQQLLTQEQAMAQTQQAVSLAMARIGSTMANPNPPTVAGAGWNMPPLLRTDEEQAALWASEEAKHGRFLAQAGPTPQAYATPIANLSIERIAAYYWSAVQQGVIQPKADLDAGTMREDGHLQATQRSIAATAFKSPIQFKPRNKTPLADAVCSFVRTVADGCGASLLQAQSDLFMSAATGHAGEEIVWQTPAPISFSVGKKLVTAKGAKGIASLEAVHNRNFRVDPVQRKVLVDAGGNRFIDPFLSPSGYPTRKLIYHGGYGSGDPHQRGYQYAANPLCLFKKIGLSRFMVALELWGVQTPYMQYEENNYADPGDFSAAERFISAIGLGKPAVLNKKFGEVKTTPPAQGLDSNGVHFTLCGFVNAEISKMGAGQTLSLEIGGVGAYAAANVHENSKEDVSIIHDRLLLMTLQDQFARYVVEENAQSLADCLSATPEQILACVPVVYRMTDRRIDPVQRLSMFVTAKNELGMAVDPDQIAEECAFRVVATEQPHETDLTDQQEQPAGEDAGSAEQGDLAAEEADLP